MCEERINIIMDKYGKAISASRRKDLRDTLSKASDNDFEAIMKVKVKNRTAALWFSIFPSGFFGAGRFFIGTKGMGILRLVITIVMIVLLIPLGEVAPIWFMQTFQYIVILGNILLHLYDIYFTLSRVSDDNYNKLDFSINV